MHYHRSYWLCHTSDNVPRTLRQNRSPSGPARLRADRHAIDTDSGCGDCRLNRSEGNKLCCWLRQFWCGVALIVRARTPRAAHSSMTSDSSIEPEAALELPQPFDENDRTHFGGIYELPEAPSASLKTLSGPSSSSLGSGSDRIVCIRRGAMLSIGFRKSFHRPITFRSRSVTRGAPDTRLSR